MSHGYFTRPATAKSKYLCPNSLEYTNLELSNGDKYLGEIQLDMKHGSGVYNTQDWEYTGEWKHNKRHGNGLWKYTNGTIYDGDWKDDYRHGHGKQRFPDGTMIDCEFKKDMPIGKGKKIFPNQAYYEGDIYKGMMHGYGKISFPDGTTHEGHFKNDTPCGNGTKQGKNFTISGIFQSYSSVTWQMGVKKLVKGPNEIYQYRGALKNTQIDTKGEFKWPDGRHYFGQFLNGTMNGKGKLRKCLANILLSKSMIRSVI